MSTLKWFGKIEAAENDRATATAPSPLPPFDLDVLGGDTRWHRFKVRATRWFFLSLFWLARRFFPVFPFLGWITVTRAADVKAVLDDPDTFGVPYGPEMADLNEQKATFLLGLDAKPHTDQRKIIHAALDATGTAALKEQTTRIAAELVAGSGGRLDVMSDFFTRTATETCATFMGLAIPDPDAFAEWSFALTALLFGDPFGDPPTRALALNAAARIRVVIERSLDRARDFPPPGDPVTLIDHLVAVEGKPGGPTPAENVAILLGLVTGFIPTTTLAAGRILDRLIAQPEMMAAAVAAGPDEKKLQAVLMEIARLNPAIQPGVFRFARTEGRIGRRRIAQGTILLVSTFSALRDLPSGDRFDPDRAPQSKLMFGWGSHNCLGELIAKLQLTALFGVLLRQANLRPAAGRAGGMGWVGPITRHLTMTFDLAAGARPQTMLTIGVPVTSKASKADIDAAIDKLRNPATDDVREALDAAAIVHFASMSCVETDSADGAALVVLLDLCVDGPPRAALAAVAEHAPPGLAGIFNLAMARAPASLRDILLDPAHLVDDGTRALTSTRLDFAGTPDLTIPDIAAQADLAAFAQDAVDDYMRGHLGEGGRAIKAVDYVRDLIAGDVRLQVQIARYRAGDKGAAADGLAALLERGAAFRMLLIRPRTLRYDFAHWSDPGPAALDPLSRLRDFWHSGAGQRTRRIVFGAAAVFVVGFAVYEQFVGHWADGAGVLPVAARFATAAGAAVVLSVLAAAGALYFLIRRLLAQEEADVPDPPTANLAAVTAAAASENQPDYLQNHFMSVTTIKPGWLRRLTLALALWSVDQTVRLRFRPGYVATMGTIHFAKWFLLPGTEKFIFFASYDGSWESYLEDFITRVHQGQSAVWSNCVGFPRTRWLTREGAQDGAKFKRFVRNHQQIAPLWYTRFPELTTDQMRRNAMIHYGLTRALNDTAARSWLDLFGSTQPPAGTIEAEEVQSLTFTGFGTLDWSRCLIVTVPGGRPAAQAWLRHVMGHDDNPASPPVVPPTFGDLPLFGVKLDLAMTIAFTTAGLKAMGLGDVAGDGLATFPPVFNLGMSSRARVLGDDGDAAPKNWAWGDAAPTPHVAHAMLVVYATDRDALKAAAGAHEEWLTANGGSVIQSLTTHRVGHSANQAEPFGFRDNISQPIIRGTERFVHDALPCDVMAPGEFIMGYPDNQNYIAPAVTVAPERDSHNRLPIVAGPRPALFPDFDADDPAYAPRDFSRNGSFLAVRQLAQDVAGFRSFTTARAAELTTAYPALDRLTGGRIDGKWVAAKMMGRWQDGTPLLDARGPVSPRLAAGITAPAPDNDFAFGLDDPAGLRCPLGAHIRRANPRDSRQPGDAAEQAITNRHRLLRRGRRYGPAEAARGQDGSDGHARWPESSEGEQGLMFIALCGDLERQFEFVQQTWLNSATFHGLQNETDAIIGGDSGNRRVFTIPTAAGPARITEIKSFVTVRSGGYFFMPSRAALLYLAKAA